MAARQKLKCPEVQGWLRNVPEGLRSRHSGPWLSDLSSGPSSTQPPCLDLGRDKSLGVWGSPTPFPEKSLELNYHPVGISEQATPTATGPR